MAYSLYCKRYPHEIQKKTIETHCYRQNSKLESCIKDTTFFLFREKNCWVSFFLNHPHAKFLYAWECVTDKNIFLFHESSIPYTLNQTAKP